MDFALTEEQQELAGLAGQILADRMTPEHLKALDGSDEWFDRDTWAELAKANLLGLCIPEADGGLGFGFLELCLVLSELGRHVAPVPLLPTLVAASTIAELGEGEQRAVLRRVVDGTAVLTLALAEPGAPADEPATTAERAGDGWRLTGTKTAVPMVHVAESLLVPASAGGEGVGVFVVPVDAANLHAGRQATMAHEPQFEVRLDGVEVPGDALLGDVGRDAIDWIVARATVAYCAIATGLADRAVRITAQYTCEREQFDRPIGTFQAVGQRMADAYIDTTAIELTMLQAASHLAEGRAVPDEVATAKFWAAEGGSRVVHAALHVHGGISIDVDYPIHRYFLWMKQIENTLGGASFHLSRLGRILAEEPV